MQERTARMMRKRAQHEVLHIVLAFFIGGEKVISASEDIPSIKPKATVKSQNFPHRQSLQMVHTRFVQDLPKRLPMRPSGFPK